MVFILIEIHARNMIRYYIQEYDYRDPQNVNLPDFGSEALENVQLSGCSE